jgi:hypothetical protein
MLPKTHVIAGIILSFAIFLLWPAIGLFYLLIFFFSSILIDFDHYLYFIWAKKDFSLAHAYKWFVAKRDFIRSLPLSKKAKYQHAVLIFHGIELWVIVLLLSFIHPMFVYVLFGITIHMFFDFIEIIYYKNPIYSKISQIYVYFSNKNKKPLPF